MNVKILSLNLWRGALIENTIEFLKKENPDILILQEVHSGTDPALQPSLRSFELIKETFDYIDDYYEAGLLHHRPEGKIPEGVAIFSGFPITSRNMTYFNETFNDDYHDILENYPSYPRMLQHASLNTPAGEVNVFNIHGVWDLDGDNYSERRQNMSRIIIEAIRDKPNVILGGDTNAKPTNQAMQDIEQHLTSVFGDELTTTFNMRRKDNPGYATAAVDLLFVSPNIEILSKKCPDVDISDHLPVMAEIRFS